MSDTPNILNSAVSCLLYADDLFMSTSALGLQNKPNTSRLNKYCQMWNLNVNIKKTKIVIFSPSG
jgi:hypothetical protein